MIKTSEPLALTYNLGHCLHRASQQADDAFLAAAAGLDLTARQLTVLEIIEQADRPSQMDICSHSGIDRSTVADMVLRLIKKGFIERRRSRSDARRYALQLTEAGHQVLQAARPIAREVEARIAAGLPSMDVAEVVANLKAISAADTRPI